MTITTLPKDVLGMILTNPAITRDQNSLIHCYNVNIRFRELISKFLNAHPNYPSYYPNLTLLNLITHAIHNIKDLERCVRYCCIEKMQAVKINIFGSNHFGTLEITRNAEVITVWANSQLISPHGQNPHTPDTAKAPLDFSISGHGINLKTPQNAAVVKAIQKVLAEQNSATWILRRIRDNYVPY